MSVLAHRRTPHCMPLCWSMIHRAAWGSGVAQLSVVGFGSRCESKCISDTNIVFVSCSWGPAGESKPKPK